MVNRSSKLILIKRCFLYGNNGQPSIFGTITRRTTEIGVQSFTLAENVRGNGEERSRGNVLPPFFSLGGKLNGTTWMNTGDR